MPTTETPTPVLLDVQTVADELQIAPVEVKRIMARGELPATRIGDGPFKVTREALESYVKRGAPDVRLNDYTLGGSWFDYSIRNLADGFYSAVVDASAEQKPSDEVIRQRFEANKFATSLDFLIANRGAVAEVLAKPVPVSIHSLPSERESRFPDWKSLYAADTLRKTALSAVRAKNRVESPLSVLYESKAAYQEITDAAYADASRRNIVWSKTYSYTGGPWGVIPIQRRAVFVFPLAEVFTPAAKERLLKLAF